jgi:hypothetical protein
MSCRYRNYLIVLSLSIIWVLLAFADGWGADFKVSFTNVDNRATSHTLLINQDPVLLAAPISVFQNWIFTKAENSMVVDSSLFTRSGSRFSTINTQTNIHAHVTDLVTESLEYSGKMMLSATDGGIGVTFLSDYPNTDSYYRIRGYTTGVMHVAPHPQTAVNAGEFTFQGEINSKFTPKPQVWFHFKIRVLVMPSGTRIQAMFWNDGRLQPVDWQIDATDTSERRYTQGKVGLWSGGVGEKNWEDLTVKKLQYVSEGEVEGVNSFAFSKEIPYGTHAVVLQSRAEYQDLRSKVSQPFEWLYEESEPEEILIEVTQPTIIKIIVK